VRGTAQRGASCSSIGDANSRDVPEIRTLIEKIKDDRKKRAEAKARRMLLRRPKRLTKR
jgi:hypothetical protein